MQDGQITNINHVDEKISNLKVPTNLLDMIYVGRCEVETKSCSDHSGDFTDINIWDRSLSVDEMIGWTNCSTIISGNLINWNSSNWEVSGMKNYSTKYPEICNPPVLGLVFFPGLMNNSRAVNLCKKFKGEINVVSDEKNKNDLVNFINNSTKCFETSSGKNRLIWNGWSDEVDEGVFASINNQSKVYDFKLQERFWADGEPNGKTVENCGALFLNDGKYAGGRYNDLPCSNEACVACQLPSLPIFKMRGKKIKYN